MRLVQPMLQEELPPSSLRLLVSSSQGLLIGVESLERLDGCVERAVLARLAACGTVPAAVGELLIKEIVNEAIEALSLVPMCCREPHQHRCDTGLWNPPSVLPLPQALTPGQRRWVTRRQSKPQQVEQRIRRRDPLRRVIPAAPAAVGILQREQLGAP